jgi:hypothetical protein
MLRQMRTYRDGTTWVRWVDGIDPGSEIQRRISRLPAGWNCAACSSNDPSWAEAPENTPLPRIDLIYDCNACGRTTYQGRVAAVR